MEIFPKHDSYFGGRFWDALNVFFTFFLQTLSGTSCACAVSLFINLRLVRGLDAPINNNNANYCRARYHLATPALREIALLLGERTTTSIPDEYAPFLNGRLDRVKLVDGATVTLPDTPENQAEFPQPDSQQPGLGFPSTNKNVPRNQE
ncbi:MAG: hypothetical protein LBG58_04850 [Planctomycetaceae bacterium]|nr:hypothetical protein [Planctomycetaceae bacterium]